MPRLQAPSLGMEGVDQVRWGSARQIGSQFQHPTDKAQSGPEQSPCPAPLGVAPLFAGRRLGVSPGIECRLGEGWGRSLRREGRVSLMEAGPKAALGVAYWRGRGL